ncbi:MlaA family lipoprotein [Luteimonas sp. e5]
MKLPRRLLPSLALALLLSACAGPAPRAPQSPPPVVDHAVDIDTDTGAVQPIEAQEGSAGDMAPAASTLVVTAIEDSPSTDTDAATASHPPPAADGSQTDPADAQRTEAEDDFILLYGQAEYDPLADPTLPAAVQLPASYDPWEPMNRRVHAFNNGLDRIVLRPVARAYMAVVPRPLRLGVSNFFNNLGQPVSALNALLQGRPKDAAIALLRFSVNTTLGIGGLFDPASRMKIPYRDEDFGQTLAVWGWRQSRYLELPLFGPRTLRDVFGMAGDAPLSPLPHVKDNAQRAALQTLQVVDIRTRLFSVDAMREGAVDEYALYRDAWLQRRNYQIMSGLRSQQTQADEGLPDYLQEEEENPSMPVDVIPIPIPN